MSAPHNSPARQPEVEAAAADWLVRQDRGLDAAEQDAFLHFSDVDQSVISFVRWSKEKEEGVLWGFNFTPVVRSAYRIGAPRPGRYEEILNTDSACYGGSGIGNMGGLPAGDEEAHGQPHSLMLTLPPLGAVAFAVPPRPPDIET